MSKYVTKTFFFVICVVLCEQLELYHLLLFHKGLLSFGVLLTAERSGNKVSQTITAYLLFFVCPSVLG